MTKVFQYLLFIALLTLFSGVRDSRADLKHRYSFTNDANDSVGSAHGTANGSVAVGGGAAVFDGNPGSFVDLPPGIISNYTSVSFDFWIDVGPNGNWPELYAFGDRDANGAGSHMLMFTPHSGNNDFRMSFSDADPGYTHEFVVTQPGVLDNLGPIHIVCVYNPATSFMGLYTNGVLAASRSDLGSFFNLTNIWNVHSWLGQSLYAPDAAYYGSIDEFRIYDHALNAIEIAGSQVAGPDTVGNDPGAITSLSLTAKTPLVNGSSGQASASANFAQISGVNLTGLPGLVFTSSNTNVFTVSSNGTVSAVGVGSGTLTVTYNGATATQPINVTSSVATTLTHRYNFNTDANDSVGTAHGVLQAGAFVNEGQVALDGAAAYVEFPPDMLTNYDSVTFEAWVTDLGSANWARVWDFGNSVNGPGQQGGGTRYMFLTLPGGGGNLAGSYTITGVSDQVLEWIGGRPPVGKPTHIVWTTDVAFHTGRLYVDGVLVGINTNMTSSPRDVGSTVNDWLGRSQYNDPYFNGTIDEFRLYNGAITPLQAALDAAAGPNNIITNAGALQSLQLTLGTNQVVFGGFPVRAQLLATYANVSNVNVTTIEGVTFQSADTRVAAINSAGIITPMALSNTVLTATFGGKTGTLALTVSAPVGYTNATLAHRYSFGDADGSTTAKDSVGTADGIIMGTGAVFGNGQLTLPGGTSSSADPATIAAYVDLPNGIISPLPNISFEAWITWQGSGSWQRIFDFGTSATGEDVSDGNGSYLFLSPQGPDAMRFSVRDPISNAEPAPLTSSARLGTNETYVAVVYNYAANVASLYSNAVLVAQGLAPVDISTISDVNNWLGRSQWPDAIFQGKFNEFRIWNGVLLPNEVAAHFSAGPDSLEPVPSAPVLSVALNNQNVTLSWPTTAGYALQKTSQLGAGATWTPVTENPSTANGTSTVSVPIGAGNQFFRLAK